ncbi:phosphate ABC transporter ATP-binding protein [Clostridium oceanicum]|uniref:Phosphate ABC transporter ATP-binding protein n=1 Tax=Clostridium oceanicum TaxID=1543 RepID=A0ABN1JR57_9CLOT
MDNILDIQDLNVYLDKKHILKNISLPIEKNKITAIIGPSGCGKSTFLKTLNRLVEETENANISGKINFEGKNINKMPLEDLRKDIGYVFQTPATFPFSIYKNISYVLKYYGIKNKALVSDIVEQKLKLVGLYDEVKDDLKISSLKLSGGQRQRLCIARALAVEPKVLLMDEPCSALDVLNTSIIEDMLLNLKTTYTIVIVTHNLAQAKRISDNTAFILDGKIIEYSSTKKLFENPKDQRTLNYIGGLFG